jgi:hypothetical protein
VLCKVYNIYNVYIRKSKIVEFETYSYTTVYALGNWNCVLIALIVNS